MKIMINIVVGGQDSKSINIISEFTRTWMIFTLLLLSFLLHSSREKEKHLNVMKSQINSHVFLS